MFIVEDIVLSEPIRTIFCDTSIGVFIVDTLVSGGIKDFPFIAATFVLDCLEALSFVTDCFVSKTKRLYQHLWNLILNFIQHFILLKSIDTKIILPIHDKIGKS